VDCDNDRLFAWVEREQFAYYLTVAYMSANPADWPSFRRAIHGALVAALYLDRQLAHDAASSVSHWSADAEPTGLQALHPVSEAHPPGHRRAALSEVR